MPKVQEVGEDRFQERWSWFKEELGEVIIEDMTHLQLIEDNTLDRRGEMSRTRVDN